MKHFGSKIKPGIFRCQAFLHHKHQSPNLPVIPVIEVSPRTANLSRKGGNYLPESRSVKTTKDTKAPKRAQRILLPLCVLCESFVPFVVGNGFGA
jgi:hypothetical protein